MTHPNHLQDSGAGNDTEIRAASQGAFAGSDIASDEGQIAGCSANNLSEPGKAGVRGSIPRPSTINTRAGARIGDGQTVVGSTEAVMEFLGLSPQHNEHCKGYQWFQYLADSDKRMENVRAAARKIIAARRAIEDAAEVDQRKHERV